jgi:hypothetical protein
MAANAVAYGFVGLQHLFAERTATVGESTIYAAVQQSAAEYTRQVNAMLAGLAQRETRYKFRYYLAGSGTLQPLDEWGNPLPVRPAGYYDVALPIQGGGTAFGDNRITRALMTVEEANRRTLHAMSMDANWLKRHMMAALLDKTTWTYADPEQGDLVIQPLANGDTVTFQRMNGSASTDNHYIAQAAAIADATNPYPVIYNELAEHPGNSGPYVAYIASNLRTTTEALALFEPVGDPDIVLGADSNRLVGQLDRGIGHEVLGKVGKLWVIEWQDLPDNYIIGHARGTAPILGMREYPAAALQGLFTENHSPDGNLMEARFLRYAGFGVLNRVGAVAYFVSAGDTTYDNPTGYSAPLAV